MALRSNLSFFYLRMELVIGKCRDLKHDRIFSSFVVIPERNYNTYVGQDYIVLDLYQTIDTEQEYLPLNHNIPCAEPITDGIKATWHNIPPYCHQGEF